MQEPTALVTFIIIIASGIITFQGFKSPALFNRLLFDNRAIQQNKEYFRLITSGFLHADWMHFAFNMFSLYSFGKYLELIYSPVNLLIIYFASIVGGNLLSLVIYRNSLYRAIGASGGVCGVIYASIFLLPGGSIYILPIPFAIPSWVYAILFLLISFYGLRSARGNIGHVAHLGGALIGLAVTFLLFPKALFAQPELLALILAISGGIFIITLWKKPQAK
ncbi:MAG: rhomboid family intramembrane serine protease [Verrucomicrobia bacterium]|nr:rhomboid family intramembrane serine protease [Verrucomicrobiota bacterium]